MDDRQGERTYPQKQEIRASDYMNMSPKSTKEQNTSSSKQALLWINIQEHSFIFKGKQHSFVLY